MEEVLIALVGVTENKKFDTDTWRVLYPTTHPHQPKMETDLKHPPPSNILQRLTN